MRRQLAIVHNPVFGGGVNQTVRLAAPLRTLGWETVMRTPAVPEAAPTLARIREAGVPVEPIELHRLRMTSDPRPNVALLRSLRREIGRLRGLIRRERIDLVQAFGPTNPHLAIAGHLEGKAVVWSLYDSVLPPALCAVPMRLVTALADVVLTTGDGLADLHPGARRLGERCIAVYPPVDPDVFRPDAGRRLAARAELGVPDDALLVGTVGNRNPTKGHDHLARAAAWVRDRGHDAYFRVLGQRSPVHAEHEAAVEAEIRALGLGDRFAFVDPGRRVAELLPALDVFAMSSVPRSEGVPTVLLEAMACELPCVATDVGAVAELVDTGATGTVVPALDDEALGRAIGELLGDAGRRAEYGAEGRRRVLDRYRTERCAEVYVAAFERALANRQARTAN